MPEGTPVGVGGDGKFWKAFSPFNGIIVNAPANLDGSDIQKVFNIGIDKWVIVYRIGGDGQVVACTLDQDTNTLTFGTEYQISNASENMDGCPLDADKFVVAIANSGNDAKAYVFSASGVAITLRDSPTIGYNEYTRVACCQLDTDKFAFHCYTDDTNNRKTGFCTVSTYTITIVDSSTNVSTLYNRDVIVLTKIATDKFIMVGSSGASLVCTTSSSTFISGISVDLSTEFGLSATVSVVSITDNEFYANIKDNIIHATVSGTTITKGTETAISTETPSLATMFSDGTNAWAYMGYSTDPYLESGLYKIESNVPVHKQYMKSDDVTKNAKAGTGDGNWLLISGVLGNQDIQFNRFGMSDNYVGFTESAISKDVEGRIINKGIVGGQTGLITGAEYSIQKGALIFGGKSDKKVSALNATSIII